MMTLELQQQNLQTGKQLKYQQLKAHPKHAKDWNHSSADDFGWLVQGVGGQIVGTNTFFHTQASSTTR
jgi:hypothetical protein